MPPELHRHEEVAASKPKYSEIVRLENYHFFHESITARARRIRSLAPMVTQARLLHEKAAESYCQWIVVCQFEEPVQFFSRVRELLTSIPAKEVQFHVSRATLLEVNATNRRTLPKVT